MIRIAVLDDYQGIAADFADWNRLAADVEFFSDHLEELDALVDRLTPFEVVVAMRERTPFTSELLAGLPNLRLLVTTGMRNASIDLEAAAEAGILVCGTPSSGFATAELSFAFIQVLARGMLTEIEGVRSGRWQVGIGRDLRGSRLGVVGLGRVGADVARFGQAFGMDVVGWSPNLTDDRCHELGVTHVDKEELLRTSDFVTLHLKLGERSVGVISKPDLDLMKPAAYLINTSRGPLVDTDALIHAIDSGSIAGAGLDVFEPEPLPLDHRLRSHPRILCTPHIGYVTAQTYEVFYQGVVEDIAAWMEGEPIRVLT